MTDDENKNQWELAPRSKVNALVLGNWVLLACVAVIVAAHLFLNAQYGIHRDEMYFVACGQRLAAGFVDHPPLVPLVARLSCALGGCDVVGLRLTSLGARIATVLLTLRLVRLLGGRLFAEAVAGVAVVVAPAYLRMGKILCIPVFEPVFWTAAGLVVVHLLRGAKPKWWLALGFIVGVGILNKHTMLVWTLGALCALLMSSRFRSHLCSPWLWGGLALAVLVALPNLMWQGQNDWATVQFLKAIRIGMLAEIPRYLFLLGQLLYMHPFAAIIWVPGLWACFKGGNGREEFRLFGLIYVVALGIFLVTRGKPYYLAAAYPPLFAAGAVVWERRLIKTATRAAFLGAQMSSGLLLAALTLPVMPLPRLDAAIGKVLGSIVPPLALTHDLHDEFGWKELAEVVADSWHRLSPAERARAAIVTGNYGEAAALDYFGRNLGLPPAASGHMNYFLWGPQKPDADLILAVGLAPGWLDSQCDQVEVIAIADHELATPWERHTPVVLCRGLRRPLGELWEELKQFDNALVRRN